MLRHHFCRAAGFEKREDALQLVRCNGLRRADGGHALADHRGGIWHCADQLDVLAEPPGDCLNRFAGGDRDDDLVCCHRITDLCDDLLIKLRLDREKDDLRLRGLAIVRCRVDAVCPGGIVECLLMERRDDHILRLQELLRENSPENRFCHISASDKSKLHS